MKKNNKKETISKDHMAVILEDIQSQFKAFGEGQQITNRELKNLNEKVDDNHKEFVEFRDETRNNFKAVAEAFTEVNDKIDNLDNRVGSLEIKFDNMQGTIDNMQGTIDNMQGDINSMQSDISNMQSDISNMQSDISNMQGDINNMQGTIDNMQGDITEIKHKLSEKVDLKDFQALEKRFIKLEKLVFAKLA